MIVKDILEKLEKNGYEAYVVGGYVRDLLLGKKSYDIDICTNCLPKELVKIFNTNNNVNYGSLNIKIKKYNIDITTYRKDLKYENRRPTKIEYTNNLLDDTYRRDFTVNAICMNKNGDIIDYTSGCNDIKNKCIRMIGNIDTKLKEDPLRILRAIRFACVLDFDIESNLYNSIIKHYKYVNELSLDRIKSEINKILLSPNYKKGLSILKETKILKLLNIECDNIKYINDINGMWAQINTSTIFPFTKTEKETIIKIKEVLKYNKIDNYILYKYGLYISQISGNIMGYTKKEINNMFNELNLVNKNDLNIKSSDIVEILNIEYTKLSSVKNKIINYILSGVLKNEEVIIKEYLNNNKEVFLNE